MTIVLSAAYLLSRPSNSYPDTLLSNSASNFVSTASCILRPRILRLVSLVYQVCVFKEGLTIKRVQIVDRMRSSAELNANSYSSWKKW